jgi:hypothetical protein
MATGILRKTGRAWNKAERFWKLWTGLVRSLENYTK